MAWITKQEIDQRLSEIASNKSLALPVVRKKALEQFYQTNWEKTALAPTAPFHFGKNELQKISISAYIPKGLEDNPRLVFVDGVFDAGNSKTSSTKELTLQAVSTTSPMVQKEMEEMHLPNDKHYQGTFLDFNSAVFQEGAMIHVATNAKVEKSVLLVFVSTEQSHASLSVLKNFIVLEKSSQANVVELYVGQAKSASLTNVFTHIHVGENAHLEHCKIQQESQQAFHLGGMTSFQEKHSRLHSLSTAFGSLHSSLDTLSILNEGSQCTLSGLYFGKQNQTLSHYTCIDHAQPNSVSHELYKGILDGTSKGDFTGKIIVRPNAQKIDSKQLSKSLLLSKDATANTTPQLEIFADDVKCSHGATIGALDDQEVFYLRSRGLTLEQAKQELVGAYAQEALHAYQEPMIAQYLSDLLKERLAGN